MYAIACPEPESFSACRKWRSHGLSGSLSAVGQVLIKALGGEGELEEAGVIVDKSELLSVAFRVLASSPLPLIDEVTSALGLSQVRTCKGSHRRL